MAFEQRQQRSVDPVASWPGRPEPLPCRAPRRQDLRRLAAHDLDWKAYNARVAERPSAQKVNADRKAAQAQFAAAQATK